MSAVAEYKLELTCADGTGTTTHYKAEKRWGTAALISGGVRSTVSLTGSAFTAFTIPTGAVALAICIPTSATSLFLKAATGDATGIPITPTSNGKGIDCFLSLGASPTVGILNSGSTVSVDLIIL
jgi:hypothetical protein